MKTLKIILLVAEIFISVCGTASAEKLGSSPTLNPTTHVSLSGEYSLFVKPTDRLGRGPADYRFTKGGETLWEQRLPFTLWAFGVTDSGHVAGYAYTHGLEGFSGGGDTAGRGDFVVVVLSPKGAVIAREVHPREDSRFLHESPNPLAEGLMIDELGKRMIVRIKDADSNKHIEQWWIYDMASGQRTATLEPQRPAGGNEAHALILAARAVPGTPLILVHWWMSDFPRVGAVFTLVDPQGNTVWSLHLDEDYSVPADEKKEDDIRAMISKEGAILDVRANGAFDLCFVKDQLRVSYVVAQQSPGKWDVKQTGQAPLAVQRPPSQPASFPALTLQKLGETTLSTRMTQNDRPIHDLAAFEFDPEGRICALRAGPGLLLLSQEGKVVRELQLPAQQIPGVVRYSNPANVGHGRFVVSVSSAAIGGVAQWFLADFDAGTVKTLDIQACPTVDAVAGFADGRFAALTTRHEKYTMTSSIFFFDPDGKLLWQKEQHGYSGKPDDLLSPQDIAPYGADAIAVLDNIGGTIHIFDRKGHFQRAINLEKTWGRKPSHPTDIAPDRDGGFLVYDFQAKQTLVRLDGNGAIRFESVPRLADGRPFRVRDGVKCSPQGDLWTSDGDSLFRLSADSTVDLVVGQEPTPSSLSEPCCMEVGADDRIYVGDRRTKTVHVFNSSGNAVGQCIPHADDLTEMSQVNHIAVSREGDIYISLDFPSTNKYLHFRKNMTREDWARIDVEKDVPSFQQWYFQPSTDLCWIVGYEDIFLVRNLRETVRRITQRSDGRWLEHPATAAVAADGALVVLTSGQAGALSVNTYRANGDAQTTFDVPSEWLGARLAYDGQHIFGLVRSTVFVLGVDGRALGRFALPAEAENVEWHGPYVAAQGKEVWFINGRDMKLHRYSIPAQFAPSP